MAADRQRGKQRQSAEVESCRFEAKFIANISVQGVNSKHTQTQKQAQTNTNTNTNADKQGIKLRKPAALRP